MNCCVIFGGGDLNADSVNIPKGAAVIAADSGYRHCLRLGIVPDLILGDFDSLDAELPQEIEIIRSPAEKDDTDMLLAVKTGFERGFELFVMYGALGGRISHTMANIQALEYISERGGKGVIMGDGCVILLQTEGKADYVNEGYRYISLFAVTESAEVAAEGVKYSGDLDLTRDFPLGVSNEFSAKTAKITVKSGKILVILEK